MSTSSAKKKCFFGVRALIGLSSNCIYPFGLFILYLLMTIGDWGSYSERSEPQGLRREDLRWRRMGKSSQVKETKETGGGRRRRRMYGRLIFGGINFNRESVRG